MKQPYYDTEVIEVSVKVKVSWRAGDEEAKAYVMEEARNVYVGAKMGAHVRHGCYRVEKV